MDSDIVARMREIQGDSVLGQVRCDLLEAGLHSMAGDTEAFDAALASADRGWDEMQNPENRLLQGKDMRSACGGSVARPRRSR